MQQVGRQDSAREQQGQACLAGWVLGPMVVWEVVLWASIWVAAWQLRSGARSLVGGLGLGPLLHSQLHQGPQQEQEQRLELGQGVADQLQHEG